MSATEQAPPRHDEEEAANHLSDNGHAMTEGGNIRVPNGDAEERQEAGEETSYRSPTEWDCLNKSGVDEGSSYGLDLDPDTRCGFWIFQAPVLQPLARIECFTGFYSLAALITSTLNVYVNSQITTLERQFGFSSTQTGLIMAANDIGFLVFVLFLSYSASVFHIPRSLGVATGIFGLSGLACSMPFFLFRSTINDMVASIFATGSDNLTTSAGIASAASAGKPAGVFGDLCLPNRTDNEICDSDSGSPASTMALPSQVVTASLAIIFVGMMLQGFGKAPRYSFTVTYIDNNTGRMNTGFYMGIIIASGIFGPTLAFAMGGVFSRIFVTLEETTLTPAHPRWVGAWWLGYIVCGLLALLIATPLMFFPRRLPPKRGKRDGVKQDAAHADSKDKKKRDPSRLLATDADEAEVDKEKMAADHTSGGGIVFYLRHLKSFLRALFRLLTNPIYVSVVASTCCNIFAVSGSSAYSPKYIERMFDMPAYMANYILAAKTLCAACLGTFIGGYLSRRLQMTARPALLFTLFVEVVALLGSALSLVFSCEQPEVHNWPGDATSCSDNCACEDNSFFAVCGSDGRTYYSPCTAGCGEVLDGVYQNCTCIPGDGLASPGMCPYGCPHIYPFMGVQAIRSLFGTLAIIPKLVVYIRCVAPKDKSLAIGLSSFMTSSLGWLLGPIIFGSVIDGICTVWDVSPCGGGRGRCLLYDNDVFRLKLQGYSTVSILGSTCILTFAYVYARCTGCLDDTPPADGAKAAGGEQEGSNGGGKLLLGDLHLDVEVNGDVDIGERKDAGK